MAKGEKVAALVPRVETRNQNAIPARNMHNLATFWPSTSSETCVQSRLCGFYFPDVLISPERSAMLTRCSRSARGLINWGIIMEWTAPAFEEVCLNCEINSYASAKL